MKFGWLMLLLLFAPSCASSWWSDRADRDVAAVLAEKRTAFDRFREQELMMPGSEEGEGSKIEPLLDLADVPEEVGLAEALLVAVARNRDYLSQRESLYLSALSLTGVRNQFSVLFSGTLSSIISDSNDSRKLNDNRASLGASRILPTGGTLGVDVGGSSRGGGGDAEYDLQSDVTVSLSQPLLRDAGYETSHEALTQAERNVVYAIRDFELFREDFTIQITDRFYSLAAQLEEIKNAERNLERREFLKRQSEEKFKVRLASQVDFLSAKREYLRAQTDLLELRESFQLALDRFKIQLGLPTAFPLKIRYERPEFQEVEIALSSAVEAALHNRLDLLTARDELEDQARDLRIAMNRMLPDLDLSAAYTRSAPSDTDFGRQNYEDEFYSIGLTLNLPLERTSERNALKRAMIDLNRTKRSLSRTEDNVILEVRNSRRRVRRAEASLKIREEEILAAEKEARAAQIRFEAGETDNLRVTDALNAVLRSRNAFVRDLVEYEVARIQLFRDIGILFIDEQGMWVEP